MWEHIIVTLGRQSGPSGKAEPFRRAGPVQEAKLRELGQLGFECVGVTTLHDGALVLIFKRPFKDDNARVQIEDADGVSIGQYL